jgi:hypothetical protein
MWSQKRPNACKSQERRGVLGCSLARSAGPARHDYFFILQKNVYTYIQFIFNIKNILA